MVNCIASFIVFIIIVSAVIRFSDGDDNRPMAMILSAVGIVVVIYLFAALQIAVSG